MTVSTIPAPQTITTAAPIAGSEPAPATPEALLLLAAVGVLPSTPTAEDPRFSQEALTSTVSRLLAVKQEQDALAAEQKQLHEHLRLAHLRGDLLQHLPAGKEGSGYQITPELVLLRRPGRKQWSYTLESKQLECQLKARQSYEQQCGLASYTLGAAFWEVRSGQL
jgi:hypothetical protein